MHAAEFISRLKTVYPLPNAGAAGREQGNARRRCELLSARQSWKVRINLLAWCLWLSVPLTLLGAPPAAEDLQFFETKIRPVLVKHCYACHGPEAEEPGGKLRLDSRDAVLRGGESGPALVAGKPADSLLLRALRQEGLEMPPEGPLSPAIVRDFEQWIERGAVDPRLPAPSAADSQPGSQLHRSAATLWSLQPLTDPQPPVVKAVDWPRDPIDHFVLARIEQANLEPAIDAAPRALIRRLFYDLIGLPPTQAEIAAFLADHDELGHRATEAWVDRLLARPQFGERWGRYWLDVARYGESNGNDGLGRNPTFPHAWRYRDYVIAAFNDDLPIDQFFREQIAGDLLASDLAEVRDRRRIATGFLALGAKPAKAMNSNFDMDVVADQIDAIGRGMLGLSVGCARCHDHKFDPIPTRDYYALAGILMSSETMWGVAANEGLTAPATDLHTLESAPHVPPPADFVETVLLRDSNTGQIKAPPKPKWAPGTPLAMGLRDRAKSVDSKIHIKGESGSLGELVPRGFLSCVPLEAGSPATIQLQGSGRRELAEWVTQAAQPLTPRVFVNRVWQHLFGEGLVATPDDFGVYGAAPSHPLLLDHLATRFLRQGWSLKQLVRAMVLTRTYQLSCDDDATAIKADADGRLLTRHLRRRLDAESLRDSMLLASGELDLRPGNGSLIRHRDILVNRAGNLHEPSRQRSVYLCYLRSSPPPELAPFDLPDFTAVQGRRDVSVLSSQALHLFNSPFVLDQARALAQRACQQSASGEERVRFVFQAVLAREPESTELAAAMELVDELSTELSAAQPDSQTVTATESSAEKGPTQPTITATETGNSAAAPPTAVSAAPAVPAVGAAGPASAVAAASAAGAAELADNSTSSAGADSRMTANEQAWAAFCQALLLTNEFRYVD